MTAVTINQAAMTAAGLTCTVATDGNSAVITIPNVTNSKPMMLTVPVVSGALQLLPMRSFMHATILQKLGVAV